METPFSRRHPAPLGLVERLKKEELPTLMEQLGLSQKIAQAIAPLLAQYHVAVDFSDPGRSRLDHDTLVLLVSEVSQENRIRQLQRRLLIRLNAAGLNVNQIRVRLLPHQSDLPDLPTPPPLERKKSVLGAQILTNTLSTIQDEELRDSLARLSQAISPSPEQRAQALEQRIGEESVNLVQHNLELESTLADLSLRLEKQDLPQQEDLERYPHLKAILPRLIASRCQLEAQIATNQRQLQANYQRLQELQKASELLQHSPDEAAQFLVSEQTATILTENLPPHTLPTPRPSIIGAIAIDKLAQRTHDLALRRSLKHLTQAITPEGKLFIDQLRQDIESEKQAIIDTLLEPHLAVKEQQRLQKRHQQLEKALLTLASNPSKAKTLAQELYADDLV